MYNIFTIWGSSWGITPTKKYEIHLHPRLSLEPFDKWGLDFVGLIDPPSNQKGYIIVCTDYLKKWAEVKEIKTAIEDKVAHFLRDNIFSIFGVPREITAYQGPQFTSNLIEHIMHQHSIHHKKYAPYHPQENGQVEVTNRELENILTKTVNM